MRWSCFFMSLVSSRTPKSEFVCVIAAGLILRALLRQPRETCVRGNNVYVGYLIMRTHVLGGRRQEAYREANSESLLLPHPSVGYDLIVLITQYLE